jgi:hypothetical protein
VLFEPLVAFIHLAAGFILWQSWHKSHFCCQICQRSRKKPNVVNVTKTVLLQLQQMLLA